MSELFDFYRNRKVLITGHTGFKGTWMCSVLLELGADVTGYALEPPTKPSLFVLTNMGSKIKSITGDVRDLAHLKQVFEETRPEIVIHMAAQPIVRESYKNPVDTYEINVMGTVNVLECVRLCDSVKSFVNVTTDKVYKNKEWCWGYRENEELNGYDPYSNSKSCSELVTESYKNSFFADGRVAISTARAGNVIGGGDFAADRILPDCVRAIESGESILLRNPRSTRPYQHVLEPVCAYLLIAMKQYQEIRLQGNYNVGPDEDSCVSTEVLVSAFCKIWEKRTGKDLDYKCVVSEGPHEANFLKLDCSKIKNVLGWAPKWNYREMLEKTAVWTECYLYEGRMLQEMNRQTREYLGLPECN